MRARSKAASCRRWRPSPRSSKVHPVSILYSEHAHPVKTMSPLLLIAAAALAALLSYLLTPVAGWLSVRLGAIDNPGHRKIHHVPIPRLGGLAVIAAISVTIA